LRALLAAALIVLVAGNLALLGLTGVARLAVDQPASPRLEGVGALRTVDAKVLRGGNPTHAGIVNLQDHGVTTVVDLRAEDDAHEDDVFIESRGLDLVHLPIRDGQTPSDEQVVEFLDIVQQADGLVFVHCGAGVGRTGTMSARYLVETGQARPMAALARNLEVGPPSIEQDAYSLGIDAGPFQPALVTVSRFFDAPRRIWHYL
jgi:protein tyrosine phosphatase (PTP) superfamily phosphohydrolase (DUF442 family)